MNNVNIDIKRAVKKWASILEKVGITKADKVEWMSEYAEMHQMSQANSRLNESGVGYANAANTAGMGAVLSTPAPTVAGVQGAAGSDLATSLLPVAMKIAGQTIGLDLVASKPSPGPVIDLPFLDVRYDDTTSNGDEKPQVFKFNCSALTNVKAFIKLMVANAGVILTQGGTSARLWFHFSTASGGAYPQTGSAYNPAIEPAGSKVGWVEFLGFSRIDGTPMFRSYTQVNTASSGGWSFSATLNTFAAADVITTILSSANIENPANGLYSAGSPGLDFQSPAVNPTAPVIIGTVGSTDLNLVSALEDHLPGFVANWNRTAMPRDQDDSTMPGDIGPNYQVKRIMVGTVEVSAALRRTEIEDIKAQTGIDVVQKMEGVLVNELSQTISKHIIASIQAMAEQNRTSAPSNITTNITDGTIFDFDVTAYMAQSHVPGGETSHVLQRKLIGKLRNASNYIFTEGRIGAGEYIVTNGNLASVIADIAPYTINPTDAKMNAPGQLFPAGQVAGLTIYVDPYMTYSDNRMFLGRKNKPDQPGIIFIPYLMAQQISIISEATRAPRMFLRSRYSVAQVGFFPWKQYMSIHVYDSTNYLI